MNALNDLNRLFSRLSPSPLVLVPTEFRSSYSASDPLTIEKVTNWMNEKKVSFSDPDTSSLIFAWLFIVYSRLFDWLIDGSYTKMIGHA